MIPQDVLDGLNRQIHHELTAEYSYLALSVWFEQELLGGFAKYFGHQAEEEHEHALKLLAFVQDRGGKVTLGTVEAPRAQFASVVEALKHAQGLERANTALIHRLYEAATAAKDWGTQNRLQWFIEEQVEEEKWADELVGLAEKIGLSPGGMFMLDHRVGKRVVEAK